MRKRSILQMMAFGALAGLVTALVAVLIPWLPDAASTEAGKVDSVYWALTVISIFVFALVAGVSVFAVWKFRAGPDDTEDGKPTHGNTKLEIVWTAIPTALVTAVAIYSAVVLVQVENAPAGTPVVNVTGQQFAWSFDYPDQKISSGDLVLPVDRSTVLHMTSKDVIHSFWVPEFRMKQDVVPGITTKLVITPTKTGTFPIICTELCGLGHALMRSQAVILSQADYDAWVTKQKEQGAAGAGANGGELFSSLGCASCHMLAKANATGKVGPDLDKVLPGKDAEFIKTSIVDPNAEITPGYQPNVMPQTFGDQLSDAQVDALVKYLQDATQGG